MRFFLMASMLVFLSLPLLADGTGQPGHETLGGIDAKDSNGKTALMLATDRMDTDGVMLSLLQGADPDMTDALGYTAMMYAAWEGHIEIVRILIAAGANVNAVSDFGQTALILAADKGNDDIVALLLAAGADPDAKEYDGHTALMHAVEAEDMVLADMLFEAGADLSQIDPEGLAWIAWSRARLKRSTFEDSSKNSEALATAVHDLGLEYEALIGMDPRETNFHDACSDFIVNAEAVLAIADNGYAYIKTEYLLGLYYYNVEKDWPRAQSCFEAAAFAGKGTYMSSLALMNAAASAENNNDQDMALDYYSQVWEDHGHDAAESPKALFNIARIYESQGDLESAAIIYSLLATEFPNSEYAGLAMSKLLTMGSC